MNAKRTPLKEAAAFFALTLGLVYLVCWGPLVLFKIPAISFVEDTMGPPWAIGLFLLGGFTPSLAALFLTALWEGRAGLRRMTRRMLQFKIGWRWYLAAVGLVAATTLFQILIQRLLGHRFELSLFAAQLGSFLPLLIIGPLSEELGWRGYALDRLQTRWNALISSLLVGAAWGLWHLPLFHLVGTSQHELAIPFTGFLGATLALSVLFTWLHNNTGGSIWTAIFFHWVYTYAAQVMASGVTRSPLYNWLEYLPFLLAALLVAAVWGPKTLARSRPVPGLPSGSQP